MPELESLEDHNKRKHKEYQTSKQSQPNGIACPKCGAELVDTHPYLSLTSIPPQKDVNCTKCDYVGYRVE
jgi:DNA-directed RNA polymerase subunit RPC12/RpoP